MCPGCLLYRDACPVDLIASEPGNYSVASTAATHRESWPFGSRLLQSASGREHIDRDRQRRWSRRALSRFNLASQNRPRNRTPSPRDNKQVCIGYMPLNENARGRRVRWKPTNTLIVCATSSVWQAARVMQLCNLLLDGSLPWTSMACVGAHDITVRVIATGIVSLAVVLK